MLSRLVEAVLEGETPEVYGVLEPFNVEGASGFVDFYTQKGQFLQIYDIKTNIEDFRDTSGIIRRLKTSIKYFPKDLEREPLNLIKEVELGFLHWVVFVNLVVPPKREIIDRVVENLQLFSGIKPEVFLCIFSEKTGKMLSLPMGSYVNFYKFSDFKREFTTSIEENLQAIIELEGGRPERFNAILQRLRVHGAEKMREAREWEYQKMDEMESFEKSQSSFKKIMRYLFG
jgi:hypothetical protein